MIKEELQKEIGKLTQINTQLDEKDAQVRRNISGFLGSYEKDRYYNETKNIKILSWAEIYFELGKIQSGVKAIKDLSQLRNETYYWAGEIIKLKEKNPPKN